MVHDLVLCSVLLYSLLPSVVSVAALVVRGPFAVLKPPALTPQSLSSSSSPLPEASH
jgi:hypothetical protein